LRSEDAAHWDDLELSTLVIPPSAPLIQWRSPLARTMNDDSEAAGVIEEEFREIRLLRTADISLNIAGQGAFALLSKVP